MISKVNIQNRLQYNDYIAFLPCYGLLQSISDHTDFDFCDSKTRCMGDRQREVDRVLFRIERVPLAGTMLAFDERDNG